MPLSDFIDSPMAEDLRDADFAADYLADALNDSIDDFIIALRNVTDANGGVGETINPFWFRERESFISHCLEREGLLLILIR